MRMTDDELMSAWQRAWQAHRWTRAAGYFQLVLAASCSLLIDQAPSIYQQIDSPFRTIWSLVFIASALMCTVGAIADVLEFERRGLIPLLVSFFVFSAAVLMQGFAIGAAVLPAGLSMMGWGLIFAARWLDLRYIHKILSEGR